MSYSAKLVLHLNQGADGSTMVRELVDYPGVQISDTFLKKQKKTIRTIVYKNTQFKTLDSAVKEWKTLNQGQKHDSSQA